MSPSTGARMTDNSDQREALQFLTQLADDKGNRATRIDTHAASVFLVGDRAYKVKRAVKFSFLDFSTLEKRRDALNAELRVNKAFAPDIYLDVVALTAATNGRIQFGGDSAPVEWVLRMRRFDETKTLDRLIPERGLDDTAATVLADIVARSHIHAKKADADAWFASIKRTAAQNIEALRRFPALFQPASVDGLDARWQAMLAAHELTLHRRAARGLVRRCHGDLHLANIAIINGAPCPFDAIEFDERIASGDVFYDLAFLLMDLVRYGASASATLILNRYLAATTELNNDDGLALLPLFMSIRAAIRAQVTAAKMARPAAVARDDLAETARDYFSLAGRLADPPPPMLIAVGGLSGTGKTALARGIAPLIKPEPGAIHLRSDVERKRLAGVAETEPLPPGHYTKEESARLYEHLRRRAAAILDVGHSVVVDAVHAATDERTAIKAIAEDRNLVFKGLFLTASLEIRQQRVGRRVGDASDANADVARQQESYDLGAIDWTEVDASKAPDSTLKLAVAALGPAVRGRQQV